MADRRLALRRLHRRYSAKLAKARTLAERQHVEQAYEAELERFHQDKEPRHA